jgi:hypothetical protein
MPEFKEFVVEGEVVLGYHASDMSDRDRGVKIVQVDGSQVSLEALIARSMGFPNEDEFQAHFDRMEALRQQGVQPIDGEPDITREGVRLRIEVEVLD